MARTEIVAQSQLTHEVIKPTLIGGDSANGMFFKNNGFRKLFVITGATASATITIKGVQDANRRKQDVVITVGSDEVWESSFFEIMLFNNGGNVDVDLSSDTDIQVAVIDQQV